ncbi:TPR end-of-group domain-containing protein [Microbulbifer hydrolyticus]|uniref:Tetratricopeptide (TPR) repeat protein n=1 Tax=Microbulbifer hydrolyticus TaxID=48074 RepID=A0A6P1T990_9GAMM|nr:tetratricopeptide repeat protein [Microbulbifer hydrolyticus]MBB5210996.1 tetratricopeptide (TPR) repeat protein [Microbulbifer hydrolyticus]QHQ38193.1 tetratricopeptide repeat protein [Microbulbifer hydrolyticus]
MRSLILALTHRLPPALLAAVFVVTCAFLSAGESAQAQDADTQEAPVVTAEEAAENKKKLEELDRVSDAVDEINKPLYSPFIERYVLDELKQLRVDMAAQKVSLTENIVDRQLSAADKAITYATDTITYFFYLIAGFSSLLVIMGWTSIRDVKEKVHTLANQEISSLVEQYEERLRSIEEQLSEKTQHIEHNRDEIELTQEVHSLWLRAGREQTPTGKIAVYDQILKLRQDDGEALTYKADAVLELDEPQWAINLCLQALQIDSENGNAYYQLACAYAYLEQWEESISYLRKALDISTAYRDEALEDSAFNGLYELEEFAELMGIQPESTGGRAEGDQEGAR